MDRRRLDGGRLVSGGAPGTHGCVSQLVPGGQPALRFRVDESRAHAPPLPPNLCGYQVPFSWAECSCQNVADCQLLSPYCSGSCHAGSQSCTCRPMRRGN